VRVLQEIVARLLLMVSKRRSCRCWVVGRCGSGCCVVAGLAGRRWVVVRRYSSLGCTVGVGYGRGGGCDVVVVVPVMVVSAVVVVAIFFLVAACRFKDTGWPGLG